MLRLSWLTIIRQPARTALAVLGVAAVGALLFDMLLLSRGLVLSFRDLLDRAGFDIRVLATDAPLFAGPRIPNATGGNSHHCQAAGGRRGAAASLARRRPCRRQASGGDTATGRVRAANRISRSDRHDRSDRSGSSCPSDVDAGRGYRPAARCGCGPRDRDQSPSGPFGSSRNRRINRSCVAATRTARCRQRRS